MYYCFYFFKGLAGLLERFLKDVNELGHNVVKGKGANTVTHATNE